MSMKKPIVGLAAIGLLAVAGAASASAQENCGFMYQRAMEAYQAQSPHYTRMLEHYNARCLSGSSGGPGWEGHHRRHFQDERYERRGYGERRWEERW